MLKKKYVNLKSCKRGQEIHNPFASLLALEAKNITYSLQLPKTLLLYFVISTFMLNADNPSLLSGPLLDYPIAKLGIGLKSKQSKSTNGREREIFMNSHRICDISK